MTINIFRQRINWQTTVYGDKLADRINNLLTVNLRILCKKIVNDIPQVASIYFTGSYSRGEGTVLIEEDEIKFLSDYDLLVVSDAQSFILRLRSSKLRAFLLSTKLPNTEVMLGHPMAEIVLVNRTQIRRLSMMTSLFKYELRTVKCIYGKDLLEEVPKLNASSIPPHDGIRLLFDRMFGAIIPFTSDLLYLKPNDEKLRHLMFESVKLLLACRDALLILDGVYFPTETQRQTHFERNYPRYQSLVQDMPDFISLTKKAHRYRLRPCKEAERDAISLSFKAFEIAPRVLKVYLEKLCDMRAESWTSMISDLMEINFHPLIYELATIVLRHSVKSKWPYQHIFERPLKKILGVLTLLLLSFEENGINKEMLSKAKEIMGYDTLLTNAHNYEWKIWDFLRGYVCLYYTSPFPPPATARDYFQGMLGEVMLGLRSMLRI